MSNLFSLAKIQNQPRVVTLSNTPTGKTFKNVRVKNTLPPVNQASNQVTLPAGWIIRKDKDGDVFYENLKGGYTQWDFPTSDPLPSGWTEYISDEKVKYYVAPDGKTSYWDRPSRSGKPGKGHSEVENAAKCGTMEDVNALKRKIAELERQVANRPVGAVGNSVLAANSGLSSDPALEKYRTMLKRGVPRAAVEQKMQMNGLSPASLFGGPGVAVAAKPGFLSGITAGVTLKKTNAKPANTRKNNGKPNMGGLAREAAAMAGKLRRVNRTANIRQKLSNNTGFAKFRAELRAAANRRARANSGNALPLATMKMSVPNGLGPGSIPNNKPLKKENWWGW
jgi:hypothetical protein